MRFDNEGQRLFTAGDASIPANTPSNYTGFASAMIVNPSITADQTLIRKGTTPNSAVQDGSSEVLRKIIQFTFGTTQFEQEQGNIDISSTTSTLFTTLGIAAKSKVNGTADITALGSLDSSPYLNPGTEDKFSIQLGAAAPTTFTITAGMTAANLVSTINATYTGMASLGPGGQLVLQGTQDITIASSGVGAIGAVGLQELGLTAGTTVAVNPSFQIAVGTDNPVTVTILPTDKGSDLLTKLNAIPGITASFAPTTNFLKIVPTYGGDLTTVDGLGTPLAALGVTETSVPHAAFNAVNLGPGSNIDGRIQNGTTLADYATQMVSLQSQDAQNVDTTFKTEDNYRSTLEGQYLNTTGVNLDEEMTNLISVQNAYAASARAISAVQQMLDDLMNTFR